MTRTLTNALTQHLGRIDATATAALAGRLWTLASETNDTEGLLSVARCRHQDRTLHETIAGSRNPSIRSAWLANPTSPDDLVDRILEKENRAQVIAGAISQAHDSSDTIARSARLQTAAQRKLQAKPTIALAEALVDVDGLDDATSLLVTCTLLTASRTLSARRDGALTRRITNLAGDHGNELVAAAANWEQLATVARAGACITPDKVAETINRIWCGCDDTLDGAAPSWAFNQAVVHATSATRTLLDNNPHDQDTLNTIERHALLLKNSRLHNQVIAETSNRKAGLGVVHEANDVASLAQRVAQTGDVTAMAALAEHPHLVGTRQQRAALDTLARHNLPLAARIANASVWRIQFLGDHVTLLADSALLEQALGDTVEQRSATARDVLAGYNTDTTHGYGFYPRGRAIAALLPYAGSDAAGALTWARVHDLLRIHFLDQDVINSIVNILLERLDTADHWRCFDTLSQQWTGTFGELLDAVDALADADPQP